MSEQRWESLSSALVDTGVFIHWFRGDHNAQRFFRDPNREIYYAKVTRKELLREPIRAAEAIRIKAFLNRFRLINPDDQIAARSPNCCGSIHTCTRIPRMLSSPRRPGRKTFRC